MNKSEVEQLVLDLWNAQTLAWRQRILNDPDTFLRYRGYSWWSEETPEPETEVDWDKMVPEFTDGEWNGYTLNTVEHFGGEGQGDHVHWVFTVTDPQGNLEYWKIDGYYSSYNGSDWSSGLLHKVTPKTKQVTYYE
jgi:hypothetical protein